MNKKNEPGRIYDPSAQNSCISAIFIKITLKINKNQIKINIQIMNKGNIPQNF